MSTSPTYPGTDPEVSEEDLRVISERLNTYDRDKQDTVDARESVDEMLSHNKHKPPSAR